MKNMKLNHVIGLVVLLSVSGMAFAFDNSFTRPGRDIQQPPLPAGCEVLQVPAGNESFYQVYAIGVQIYRWNGTSWGFMGPEANLFADPNYRGKIGTHYGGPTWESKSGSFVTGRLVAGCTADPTAINWLLLERRTSEGPGIFRDVTYIQRVNTAGGLSPALPGLFVGEEKRIPYTTEYYFYRGERISN